MPELPEVETVRIGLVDRVVGRTITGVAFGVFSGVVGGTDPDSFAAAVTGERFSSIIRRGKHLWFPFEAGDGLFVHLMMTGQLLFLETASPAVRFEHLRLHLEGGSSLVYTDQRKFGRVLYIDEVRWAEIDRNLGVEPFDRRLTTRVLLAQMENRSLPIKSFLLDQRRIAGIGNIYADEALYRARIHPGRKSGTLSTEEASRLLRSMRTTLNEGINHRGTTLSNYRDANGEAGENARNLRVYGRSNGGLCARCKSPISRMVIGGRGTHFCPNCQPEQ